LSNLIDKNILNKNVIQSQPTKPLLKPPKTLEQPIEFLNF